MDFEKAYESWLEDKRLNDEAKRELVSIKNDKEQIEYRFGAELEFGTAGMRGIIGYGTNMMNVYTVSRATQGLSEFIKGLGEEAKQKGVVISYDTRLKSDEFARAAAEVLAANDIKAYLFSDVHPVPMLSFAVRCLGTVAGIMVTASHNPKQYNGYKVYGADGAQMSPEDTKVVVDSINQITDYLSAPVPTAEQKKKYIVPVPAKVDKKYYKELTKLTLSKKAVKKCGKNLKLVYTPVHGSGYIPVTTILKKIGINATVVEEQKNKDPEFSTVAVPNPEFKETLSMGIALANKIGATVVFGTDPDSDRLGVAVKNAEGEFEALSGNQVGILLLDYILTRLKEDDALPENAAVVKSFVTTGMAKAICQSFGVELFETPVGFKFIGEKIKLWERDHSHTFVFGFEESCGYLRGTHARDKDAVVASMLCAEMVCYYTYKGTTVFDRLNEIYRTYGYVLDCNVSIQYKGLNAMKEMNAVVDALKSEPVEKFDIYEVASFRDYSKDEKTDLTTGEKSPIGSPKCNCVYYELKNGSFVCVRPSGTEPKLKIYYSIKINNSTNGKQDAEAALAKLQAAVGELLEKVKQA
ncbi:MAG: phospho-sugar mutase [Clostridiales bacterium]|nr:phospho-sugar mutase [Clostridiales bacterium]